MNNLFSYLLELNISLIILFIAYRLFFEKDKNFILRRIYLLVAMLLPLLLPIIPDSISLPGSPLAPVSINLDEVTVFGTRTDTAAVGSLSLASLLLALYIAILSLGILKVLLQLGYILLAILRSDRFNAQGITLLASKSLHASSFFRYIFIDPEAKGSDSFEHILEHENTHKREWHSVDRILVELLPPWALVMPISSAHRWVLPCTPPPMAVLVHSVRIALSNSQLMFRSMTSA